MLSRCLNPYTAPAKVWLFSIAINKGLRMSSHSILLSRCLINLGSTMHTDIHHVITTVSLVHNLRSGSLLIAIVIKKYSIHSCRH